MALIFRYRLFPLGRPIVSLGGRFSRPRPVVDVTITGPARERSRQVLLDSGADDSVFPEALAGLLGVDLTQCPETIGSGIGGTPVPLRYAEVKLRLTDGKELREWPATVGFTTAHLRLPVLGFAGCLQFFKATFFGDIEKVELEINQLYPGT